MMYRNTIYNLLGLGSPILVAVFAIPFLLSELGEEKFGVLTLIWTLVSYFGLFDLGLGRSLTLSIAKLIAVDRKQDINSTVWSTLAIMLFVSLFLVGLILILDKIFISESFRSSYELGDSVIYVAMTIPFIVLTSAYRGVLEAIGAFLAVNILRVPLGVAIFLLPCMVIKIYGPHLEYVCVALALSRVIGFFLHIFAAYRTCKYISHPMFVRWEELKSLLTLGGWMSVSNIISPLMGYIDRFILAYISGASVVAFYATPNEMVTKLSIIPSALVAVLFPQFVKDFGYEKRGSLINFRNGVFLLAIGMLPICLLLYCFSFDILRLWIGESFAENSTEIFKLLVISAYVNTLAHVPYTALQSMGSAKTTALIHCAELPIFIIFLVISVLWNGAIGAAIAWTARICMDTALMYVFFFFSYRNKYELSS